MRRGITRAIVATIVLAACGSDSSEVALSGVVREPAPSVDVTTLPSLTDPGSEVTFAAQDDHLKAVYFGFTNCPDICPTTLADFTVALRKLDRLSDRADRVETLMVTVDPDRDLDVLPGYIASFVSDGVAAGTTDAEVLAEAAEPFGVVYDVRKLDDGSIEVDHSTFLYVVDDTGHLVLSWQFGASSDDMASDVEILLDRYDQ